MTQVRAAFQCSVREGRIRGHIKGPLRFFQRGSCYPTRLRWSRGSRYPLLTEATSSRVWGQAPPRHCQTAILWPLYAFQSLHTPPRHIKRLSPHPDPAGSTTLCPPFTLTKKAAFSLAGFLSKPRTHLSLLHRHLPRERNLVGGVSHQGTAKERG